MDVLQPAQADVELFERILDDMKEGRPLDTKSAEKIYSLTCQKYGMTLLHYSCLYGREESVEYFLKYLDVDVAISEGKILSGVRPIELACERGQTSIVQLLIKAGSRINYCSNLEASPLTAAAQSGSVTLIQVLLNAGADPNIIPPKGGYSVVVAIYFGHYDAAKLLLSVMDLSNLENDGHLILCQACESGYIDIAQLVIERIDVNVRNEDGSTGLQVAISCGHDAIVKMLLENGANVNATDNVGATAMHKACEMRNLSIVKSLIHYNADLSMADKNGNTPLHIAAPSCSNEFIMVLIPTANLQVKNKENETALDIALKHHNTDAVEIMQRCLIADEAAALIKSQKLDYDHRFENGATLLMLAANCDRIQVAIDAVKNGCDVNAFDHEEKTALIRACENGRIKVADYISSLPQCTINYGNRVNGGVSYISSIAWAFEKKHFEVASVLARNGAVWPIRQQGTLVLELFAPYLTTDLAVNGLLQDLPVQILNGKVVDRIGHYQSWTTFLDPLFPVNTTVRCEAVRCVMQHPSLHEGLDYPQDLYRALVYAKDKFGRSALHSTDSATREVLRDLLFFCARYEIFGGAPIHVSPSSIVVNAYDHGIFTQLFDIHANEGGELNLEGYIKCCRTIQSTWGEPDGASNDYDFFMVLDKSKSGSITKAQYLQHAEQVYGGKLKVAIKFMRNEDDFKCEIDARQNLDATYVLGLLPSASRTEFKAHLCTLQIDTDVQLTDYQHVLVLPSADRSLQDIFEKEYLSDNKIRHMMEEVARALEHIHSKGIVHGDLKMLNIVRVGNRLQLIDLDASMKIGNVAGGKWSSGILPPEMFYLLNQNEKRAYQLYWEGVSESQWRIVKPRGGYVVKGFRAGNKDDELPYKLETAAVTMDLWAFGCLLYQLHSGEQLVPTDRFQNVTERSIETAANWSDKNLQQLIRGKISNKLAVDLIERLLVVAPNKRLSLVHVLEHPYFSGTPLTDDADVSAQLVAFHSLLASEMQRVQAGVASMSVQMTHLQSSMDEVKQDIKTGLALNKTLLQVLDQTKQELMRGIYDASSVHVPTSFVILPYNILAEQEKISKPAEQTTSFLQHLNNVLEAINTAESTLDLLSQAIQSFGCGDPLFLYLIDEATGMPVVPDEMGDVYPIQIDTKTSDYVSFMTTNLPLIQGGFEILKACNNLSSFLGLVSLDDETIQCFEGITGAHTSSVELYDVLQSSVDAGDERSSVENIRGSALRELEAFFSNKDPKKTFSGLERVYMDNGQAIWTSSKWAAQFIKPSTTNVHLSPTALKYPMTSSKHLDHPYSVQISRAGDISQTVSGGTSSYQIVKEISPVLKNPLNTAGKTSVRGVMTPQQHIYEYKEVKLVVASSTGPVSAFDSSINISDVDSIDKNGNTALHLACHHGHLEKVKVLVHKSNLNAQNKDGYTSYQIAAERSINACQILQELLGVHPMTKPLRSKEEKECCEIM